ncbi:MAG TPA: L,D-transpeptidase [Candidatus Dormibacteraeota bacterium]
MRRRQAFAAALALVPLALALACGPVTQPVDPQAQQARDASSRRAWDALTRLEGARGGDDWNAYVSAFSAAPDGPAFDRLANQWTLEAQAADLARAHLYQQAGGEQGGQPKDVSGLGAALDQAAARDDAAGVVRDPAGDLQARLGGYLQLDVDAQIEQHDALRDDLQAGVDLLNGRADAKAHLVGVAGGLDALVAAAQTVGVPDTVNQEVADAKAAATAARTDDELRNATAKAQAAADALSGIINRTDAAPLPPCLPGGGGGQYIWIHLVTQQLVAYQDGCPVMALPVTTGRPALPTDRGTFRIFYKTPWYKMVSPWPPGSPFWYPTTWVEYAMEFVGDGTFIHGADWQPDDTYGPGSEYGPYASHGCVHVQSGPLVKLYAWAQLGAVVHVGD